mmetsp:Transcript_19230/g.26450  ORF Transcript_19230/g.26450 Transcript_19230/m.26450 type:complete len:197 (+) Transcript_19230:1-591(+)
MAYRKILELQILAPHSYFSVNQIFELISYFPPDSSAGYLRLQVIISLFSHIVDLENMYLIFDNVLSFDERNELFHRVGIMNVLDPMRPERLYRLDLRRNDHREWVKILVYLATNDPGGVWEEVEYRWGKYDEPVPGWTLPSTWTRADDGGVNGGPRNFGWLQVRYRCQTRVGVATALGARKVMRKRTLAGMKRAVL